MKTFIEIMKWAGAGWAIFGCIFSMGVVFADIQYKKALGLDAYYELNVINIWDVGGVMFIGIVTTIIVLTLDAVFKSGERSAAREEQKDG
ncbi:MAG: hypothetical protein E3J60_01580 [Dehalococcoidia bacterium]|nr:MAG: hypothetical protein E3J60_01580 [Dehalococcoidia bacterium]